MSRRWMSLGVIVLGWMVWSQPIAGGQSGGDVVDVQKLGPQVGASVPDFELSDQHGRLQTLKAAMGPKGAMVVFNIPYSRMTFDPGSDSSGKVIPRRCAKSARVDTGS